MKLSKQLFSLLIICNLVILGLAHAEYIEQSNIDKKIVLPVLIPLTGSAAEQGQWIRHGVELAQESFKKESKIEVVATFEDTQAEPKNAISAYQRQKVLNNIPAVITYGSGIGLALSPITNLDKVIQVGVATSSPAYRSPDDYTFRNFPSADLDAEFVVKSILNKFDTKEIAMINIQNEYGVSSKNAIKNLLVELGGKVIFEEEIEPNGIDYRSILNKLRAKNPKVVYLAVYPQEGAVFLKQAKAMGISTKFIAGPAIIGSSKFMELAGYSAEGLIVSTTVPAFLRQKNTETENFNNSYFVKYNIKPSLEHIYAARAYDAFMLIAKGLENCPSTSSECLKDYLYNIKNYSGVSGDISFDRNGDVSSTFELDIIKDGKFVEFD